jgi:hypothetical protein
MATAWVPTQFTASPGTPPLAGAYSITISGTGNETSVGGSGTATTSGTGPVGPVAGSATYTGGGAAACVNGSLVVAGTTYHLYPIMGASCSPFTTCPVPSSASLFGLATIY